MDRVTLQHPDVVRALIANEWLRADSVNKELGGLLLRPHQVDAVKRLRAMLARSGGALLCDDVGLGKTYVALAIARDYRRTLVIAPASLRDMWLTASTRAAVDIAFTSLESLSRGPPPELAHDLAIVDEAHHFRTPSTSRFQSLSAVCARSRTLLLTATPLHNRREDVTSLLSLFLGAASATLSDAAVAGHIVRRDGANTAEALPEIAASVRMTISDNASLLRALIELPPPIPPRDGGLAAVMVLHGLVRGWASSDAALRETIRRRLAKTIAIRTSLEAGIYPSRRELDRWTYGEGALQLGLALAFTTAFEGELSVLLRSAAEHERALVDLLASCPRVSVADTERIDRVRQVILRHPTAKVVAFSQFAETVRMYYGALVRVGRVAMLTSRGARIASGPITPRDAIRRFAPKASGVSAPVAAEEITLLITTDLLSEGVNLQDASVVIHLDLPWTAATLEQRTGRIARLGSRHREVFVYSLDPPASSKELLRTESIIRRKLDLAVSGIGPSRVPPLFARHQPPSRSRVEDAEIIRRVLLEWSAIALPADVITPISAFVSATRDGVVALVSVHGSLALIAGAGSDLSADSALVAEMSAAVLAQPAEAIPSKITSAVAAVTRWIERELASEDAGISDRAATVLVRRVTARLALELDGCPRHEQVNRSSRTASVQARTRSGLTLGIEREIHALLEAQATGDLLSSLERILTPTQYVHPSSSIELRALLVLRRAR